MIDYFKNFNIEIFIELLKRLQEPTLETLYMVSASTFFALLMGFPVGIIMCVTSPEGLTPKPKLNKLMSRLVNVLRSFPFIVLMIILFPISRIIIGTTIGTTATIVPLSIAAAPFVARIIESALKEVEDGSIQAAKVMGSTNFQIILKVMIPEALPSLIAGITLTIISIIGYSAMAGVIGGGGLGSLAINYGYQRFETDILVASVIVILVIVESVQFVGNKVANKIINNR